jgi:hypothetical protein
MATTKVAFLSTWKNKNLKPPKQENPFEEKNRRKRSPGRWLGLSAMSCRDFTKNKCDYRDGAPDLSDRGRFFPFNQHDKPLFHRPIKFEERKGRTKAQRELALKTATEMKGELRHLKFKKHPYYSYNKSVRRDMTASSAAELYGAERHQQADVPDWTVQFKAEPDEPEVV